jgi:tRNA pseudouridine38/39 synthase
VRKVALKFCYSGSEYNGLAFQAEPTPFLTVEGVLFGVLAQTWLVDPKAGLRAVGRNTAKGQIEGSMVQPGRYG